MAKKRANGEGSIRKRKDGRWEGRYTAGHDENGKAIYKNVLGKTQAEVLEKLHIAIEEHKGLDIVKAGKYTLGQWLDVWYDNYAMVKVRPSSHQSYRGYIDNHINPRIGNIPLTKRNPAEGCALPKQEHKEMQTIPAEQLTAFLREAKASGVFELYYIELMTGLRRGELLGLKWIDIDMRHGELRVRRQVSRINGQVVEAPLKTKNAYRNLPLSADAINVLRMQKLKCGGSEWVFPSPNGGPISPDSVLNMLHRVLKRAGLPPIRFHDLRHTFATIALQNGVDIKTLSGMLGHFSAGFTLDTYTHVTTAAQREAANTMSNVLSNAV